MACIRVPLRPDSPVLIRTPVSALEPTSLQYHLIDLITSAKTLSPNNVTVSGTGGWECNVAF